MKTDATLALQAYLGGVSILALVTLNLIGIYSLYQWIVR